MVQDFHFRSVAKAINWRVTGTVDTFVLSFLITGSAKFSGGIAATPDVIAENARPDDASMKPIQFRVPESVFVADEVLSELAEDAINPAAAA